jgi:preprotein translocase subunit Sec63
MSIEKFDVSMSPYLALDSKQIHTQPVMQGNDVYAILGISSLASNEEVALCYKRMAKAWHPDMANSAEAKEVFLKKFSEINEAHQKIKAERGV